MKSNSVGNFLDVVVSYVVYEPKNAAILKLKKSYFLNKKKSSSLNITQKFHILLCHSVDIMQQFKTLRYFSEQSNKSLHAYTNRLRRRISNKKK